MSDRHLLFEIVDALETEGLGRDEYQLQRVINVEALKIKGALRQRIKV
jgi:hypothetical protein